MPPRTKQPPPTPTHKILAKIGHKTTGEYEYECQVGVAYSEPDGFLRLVFDLQPPLGTTARVVPFAGGETGIRVVIWQDDTMVYDTGDEPGGLVYGAPAHADDSDECLVSCIDLCCHDAAHAEDGPAWDVQELELLARLFEEETLPPEED